MGVARSDPDGILAVPEVTLPRGTGTVAEVAAIAAEYDARIIYVGFPLTLEGRVGLAGEAAESFALELAGATTIPVQLVDERLSTVAAQRALRDAGRSTRQTRSVVDQAAAVVILEGALARERADGTPAGRAVTVGTEPRKEGRA